jgi:hypothetical protein
MRRVLTGIGIVCVVATLPLYVSWVSPKPRTELQDPITAAKVDLPSETAPEQTSEPSSKPKRWKRPKKDWTPEQQQVVDRAVRQARQSLGRGSALDPAFGKRFEFETGFLLEDPESGRWITETVARMDCVRADSALRKLSDSTLGRPDRCARWIDEARKKLEQLNLEPMTPREFLDAIGADMTVRAAVVYSGWERDESSRELQALETRVAPLYPANEFAARQFTARDATYRDLRAGPYSSLRTESAVADSSLP